MLIWWVDRHVYRPDRMGEKLPSDFPAYLHREYAARKGRPGRGRLWADEQFGDVEINPWPSPEEAILSDQLIDEDYGGIVIRDEDFKLLKGKSGIITDLKLIHQPLTETIIVPPNGFCRKFGRPTLTNSIGRWYKNQNADAFVVWPGNGVELIAANGAELVAHASVGPAVAPNEEMAKKFREGGVVGIWHRVDKVHDAMHRSTN